MTNKTFYILVIFWLCIIGLFWLVTSYMNVKAEQAEAEKYAKTYQCEIVQNEQTHVFEDCVLVDERIVKITFNGAAK